MANAIAGEPHQRVQFVEKGLQMSAGITLKRHIKTKSATALPVADLPCELHVMRPGGAGRSHDERIALPPSPPHAFYRNLAGHLLAREPLAVSPDSARRNIAVMEAATAAAATGQPVPVRI